MPRLNTPLNALDPANGWVNAPVHVHELSGWPVLLHFFSSSSEGSVDQVPELLALVERFKAQGLKVVGVHVPLNEGDIDTNYVEQQMRRLKVSWPVAVDDSGTEHSITRAHDVQGIPSLLVFDRNGLLRHHASGPRAVADIEAALADVTREEEASVPASAYAEGAAP
jgi:thiol-disulfide isomerase/thioredoxin